MAPCDSALGGRKSKASFDQARVSVARILLLLGCMTVPRGVMSETSGIVSVTGSYLSLERSLQSPERLTRENFAKSNKSSVRQLGRVALERNMDLDDLEAQLASYFIKGDE